MYYYFVLLNGHGCELATSEKYQTPTDLDCGVITENMVRFVRENMMDIGDQVVVRETDFSET